MEALDFSSSSGRFSILSFLANPTKSDSGKIFHQVWQICTQS